MLKILSLALIATGVLHNTLALLTMREALRRIRDGGIFNSVHSGDAQTFAFLWFIVAGFALMLIGLTFWQLADANRLGCPPPSSPCSHSPLVSPCSFPKSARYCCSPLRSPLSSPNAAANSLDKMLESRRRKARWTCGAIGAPNVPAVFRHFLCLPTQVNATAAPRCYNRAVSSHPPSP